MDLPDNVRNSNHASGMCPHNTRTGTMGGYDYTHTYIYKYKKITKKSKRSRDGVPKSIQTRIVRMVIKVKGRPYFFVSSVFGCVFLFARHLKLLY